MRINEGLSILEQYPLHVPDEFIPISNAYRRICSKNIICPADFPQWPISAMDGYAIKITDSNTYNVTGMVNAGDNPSLELKQGDAIRINTGGVVPNGANAVIKVEDVHIEDNKIILQKIPKEGENIIQVGENVKKGTVVIQKGQIIDAPEISTLKSLGYFSVPVKSFPTVTVLNTGDELVDTPPVPRGKVIESNSIMLINQIKNSFSRPLHLGNVQDNKDEILKKIKEGIHISDVLLIVGGTSMGTKDFVPSILDSMGKRIFKGLDISPGKPIGCWKIGDTMVFSMPGYPVACYLTFRYIVRKYLLHCLGTRKFDIQFPQVQAILDEDISSKKGKMQFIRVKILETGDMLVASAISKYGSSNLMSLTIADGILVVPEDTTFLPKGKKVTVDLIRV